MNYDSILIVGNGIAGTTAAFTLRENDYQGKITLVSEEPYPLYYRTRIPEMICDESGISKIVVSDSQKHIDKKIDLKLGSKISNIDLSTGTAKTDSGEQFSFDAVLLATGSGANIPPLPGAKELKGIFGLRNFEDVLKIRSWAEGKKRAVCLGGGLLGLEAAYYLSKSGLSISIVEFMDRLLPRQLDSKGGNALRSALQKHGFQFHFGCKSRKFNGEGIAESLEIEGMGTLDGDIFIVSAGVSPRRELIDHLGLTIERGVVVDENCRTNINNVFAAGDHIQFDKQVWGTWLAARHWGKRAGQVLAGKTEGFSRPPEVFRLKVTGIDLLSLGNTDLDGKGEKDGKLISRILDDKPLDGKYTKIIEESGKITGAILLGSPEKARFIESAVKDQKPWPALAKDLGIQI